LSTKSVVLKSGGTDAIKRILVALTVFAMTEYEKRSGTKLPAAVKTTIESFVDTYIGAALPAILIGKLDKAVARDALIRCLKVAGVADERGWAECGVALFQTGVTAYDAFLTTTKVSRVASIAASSGVGAAPAGTLVAVTFLYGVLVTLKDASDAKEKCDEAISKNAEARKEPVAIIDGQGYGLGEIYVKSRSHNNVNMCLIGS
jgi:hypothetical protein